MSPYKLPGSMTARQFAKAAMKVSMPPPRLAHARRVLVDGETVRDVADSEGVTIAVIYGAIHNFYT